MKLYYTPRSHFSRKVRILAGMYRLDLELVDVGNVADNQESQFGPNPLMKVPTLLDGATTVMDSDHIAQYLTRKLDPHDRWQVLTQDVDQLNLRAVMNGIMGAEVEVLLAARTGLNIQGLPRFEKLKASMCRGMDWLETQAEIFPHQLSYLGIHLVCLWDHMVFYQIIPLNHPRLAKLAQQYSHQPEVASSAPA